MGWSSANESAGHPGQGDFQRSSMGAQETSLSYLQCHFTGVLGPCQGSGAQRGSGSHRPSGLTPGPSFFLL